MGVQLLTNDSTWGAFVWGVDSWGVAVLPLDPGLTLQGNPIDTKLDTRNVLFSDGTKSEGSEIQGRKIIVSGTVVSDIGSRDDHRATMDAIRYQCSRPMLRLRVDTANYYINLKALVSITEDATTGFDRSVSVVRLTFQADDPFWYSSTLQIVSNNLTGSGRFTVDGTVGAASPVSRGLSPVITVTAPAGVSVGTFGLANVTDGGLNFGYADSALRDGASVAIDCFAGTITRTVLGVTTDATRYFSGEFLRILSKVNTFAYTGGAANVSLSWRPRWI